MTPEQHATLDTAPDTPTVARMVIGGETVDAADGQTFDVVNPANGTVIATAPLGGREDVDRAVAAAQKAFEDRKGWANWAAGKRGRTLAKFAALIKADSEELAQLESRNIGKPITGARGEIVGASLVFDYYAGAANKVFGQTIPVSKPGLDLTLREPIGVVGLIVPVELPAADGLVEGRPGPRRRQHRHPEAGELLPADRAAARRAGAGGRASRRASSTS